MYFDFICSSIKLIFLFKSRLKQREIACVLDVKQPRVSDLMNTRYQKFNYGSAKMYSILFGLTKVKQKRK